MGSVRRGSGVLAVASLALAGVLATAVPARAGDVFVEVSPTTVQAGYVVGIRASCPDNSQPATVESPAFGLVTAQPQHGVLTAAAMVADRTRPDSYRVKLTCPGGETATTTLGVLRGGHPQKGPATGFGGAAGDDPGTLLVTGGLATTVAGVVLGLCTLRRRRDGVRAVPGNRP
jgi:hypothetical protein